MKLKDCIVIEPWMMKLGLKQNDVYVLAIVSGFCNSYGKYMCSNSYLAGRIPNCTTDDIYRIVLNLVMKNILTVECDGKPDYNQSVLSINKDGINEMLQDKGYYDRVA